MKAAVLTQFGNIDKAFQIKEVDKPSPTDTQVLIEVDGFGLNYADIMAIQGNYKECPSLPAIIGYDVVGKIVEIGNKVDEFQIGDRVTAMTRFGGYAEFAVTESLACTKIPSNLSTSKAMAITTQYCTAYYCFNEVVNIYKGDKILIHAAAGGVGTAFIQLAKERGCEIFATCGSDDKVTYLKTLGIQHVINYNKLDFSEEITRITNGSGIDVIFDAVGGESVKKGVKLLSPTGKIIVFGAASITSLGFFKKIRTVLKFGFYHPIQFIGTSKSMIGVNMLKVGDYKPKLLNKCLHGVVNLITEGKLDPIADKEFHISELTNALAYLKNRKSKGKITVKW